MLRETLDSFLRMADLGGPVVVILTALSIATLAVVLYKVWQFIVSGVGQHDALLAAIEAWDVGKREAARQALDRSGSYLRPVIQLAMSGRADPRMLVAEAEIRFGRLERGVRFLETVAQIAPLLGLFGTVLGMISAFRALQDAGSSVDPSVLAGGIWVALLTTAVGLAVAMPAAVVHSWFEARLDAERVVAERAIRTIIRPVAAMDAERPEVPEQTKVDGVGQVTP